MTDDRYKKLIEICNSIIVADLTGARWNELREVLDELGELSEDARNSDLFEDDDDR